LSRIHAAVALVVALGAAGLIAACGGGGGNSEDPHQVLTQTFSNPTSITSGQFKVNLDVESSGGDQPGKFEAALGGPFQGEHGKFPQFKVDADIKAEGGSRSFSGSGGLISTGDRAFVNFQGTDYEVPQTLFDQFTTTFTQLQSQNQSQGQGNGLLKSLGIDPSSWLTGLKNEGTEDVEGTNSIHISGQADVPKLVADIKTIAQNAPQAAGLDAQQLSQLDGLTGIIKSADFDIFSGESDKILRELEANVELTPPSGTPGAPSSVNVDFKLTFSDVNQTQSISAPSSSQPLSTLLQQFGINPDQIGGALRGGIGSGGALPQSGGPPTPPSGSSSQAYLQCIQQAQGQAALQQCARLLGQ
jgi:hypothetical protein